MAGNDYNVAIKPLDTSYLKESTAHLVANLPEQIFNFGFESAKAEMPSVRSPLEMFNNMISDINKQLSNMRFILTPPAVSTATLSVPDVKAQTISNIDAGQAFDMIMEYVFKDEGGYVNHPKDPGGATNMGVTQRTYDWYCQLNKIPSKNVKDLTKEEAKQVYHRLFWEASGAKEIAEKGDAKLAYVVFDTAIHSGIPRAKKLLAKSGGDAEKMLDNRLDWLQGLKNWKTFGSGWTNRIAKIESRIECLGEQKEYLA